MAAYVRFKNKIEGRPNYYTIHSQTDIDALLLSNQYLIKLSEKLSKDFIAIRVDSSDRARALFAALVREVMNENTRNITLQPKTRIVLIRFEPMMNWVENIVEKIHETARYIMMLKYDKVHRPKDRWGDELIGEI